MYKIDILHNSVLEFSFVVWSSHSWSGVGLELVWSWSGVGLELVWSWSGVGLELVWSWSGVWSEFSFVVWSCSGVGLAHLGLT
jgi:hypothetical protein